MNTPLPADLLRVEVSPPDRRHATPRRRVEHGLVALLVLALHAAGLLAMAYLAVRTVPPPEPRPIEVAFIPLTAPPQPAIQPPAPPPPVQVATPSPPKTQVVKRAPAPKPTPRPAPPKPAEPRLTQSPTALSAEPAEPAPEPAPSPAPEPVPVAPSTAPPAPAQVIAARFDAAYLNNPAPAYPNLSRRMREEGKVMLRVVVGADGRPGHIEVAHGSGSERLDQAARDAVSRWRFVPARQGEHAIEASVLVPIIFKLEG